MRTLGKVKASWIYRQFCKSQETKASHITPAPQKISNTVPTTVRCSGVNHSMIRTKLQVWRPWKIHKTKYLNQQNSLRGLMGWLAISILTIWTKIHYYKGDQDLSKHGKYNWEQNVALLPFKIKRFWYDAWWREFCLDFNDFFKVYRDILFFLKL